MKKIVAAKHLREAERYAFGVWKGYKVLIYPGHVEFSKGKESFYVPYAISDSEWKAKTGWVS